MADSAKIEHNLALKGKPLQCDKTKSYLPIQGICIFNLILYEQRKERKLSMEYIHSSTYNSDYHFCSYNNKKENKL